MILPLIALEFSKLRATPAFWISVIGPFFLSALVFTIFFFAGESLVRQGMNPYDYFLSLGWNNSAFFLLPLYVILINALVVNVEHNNQGWKLLLTAPVSRLSIYLAKWISIVLFIFLTYVLFVLLLLGFAFLLALLKPEIGFSGYSPDLQRLFWWFFKMFVASLAMSTLQYQLSLWMKNVITPIGIGLLGVIGGLILIENWKHVEYYPWAFTSQSFLSMSQGQNQLVLHEYLSLAYMAVILVGGWLLWRKKQFR